MSKVFIKRINKEIENFNNNKNFEKYSENIIDYFSKFNIEVYVTSNINNDIYHISIQKDNKIILDLIVPEYYPFKPYNINFYNSSIYNNINNSYNKFLNNIFIKNKFINNNILYFFYKALYNHEPKFICLNKPQCYCCSSVFCSSNWSPSCTINTIILEYNEIKFIEKYSNPYNYKMLKNIYDNLHTIYLNKLPDELYNIIFNNVINI